ncbi:Rv3235 family protein [Streptomyces sp. NPDC020875]|uniref:Rv3235 family protein n=1 Tax=Streptomyces sp. NPDC020875 TaxID=3154898 RepID=UPI0033E58ABB
MLGHTVGDAYDRLVALADGAPLRPAHPAHPASPMAPVVRDCGEFRPRPGVIEAFALIATGDRLRAMAFRLEQGREDRRWRCSAVDLGDRDDPDHPENSDNPNNPDNNV